MYKDGVRGSFRVRPNQRYRPRKERKSQTRRNVQKEKNRGGDPATGGSLSRNSPKRKRAFKWMRFSGDTLVTHSIFNFIDNHRDKKWLTNTRYKLLPSRVPSESRSFPNDRCVAATAGVHRLTLISTVSPTSTSSGSSLIVHERDHCPFPLVTA